MSDHPSEIIFLCEKAKQALSEVANPMQSVNSYISVLVALLSKQSALTLTELRQLDALVCKLQATAEGFSLPELHNKLNRFVQRCHAHRKK